MIQGLYNALPWVIAGILVVAMVVLAIFYRSVAAPLRSLITMIYTLIFVYGLGVSVFQGGLLKWTGLSGLQPYGKFTWMAVAGSFPVMIGLLL